MVKKDSPLPLKEIKKFRQFRFLVVLQRFQSFCHRPVAAGVPVLLLLLLGGLGRALPLLLPLSLLPPIKWG